MREVRDAIFARHLSGRIFTFPTFSPSSMKTEHSPDESHLHEGYLSLLNEREWALGMTSSQEQAYLRWLTSRLYSGRGAIAELGVWLGSLTRSMVRGLKENPHIPDEARRIHVYDLFKWDHTMEDSVGHLPIKGRFKPSEDYSSLYREVIREELDFVEINQCDLQFASWNGGPIEILVVDVMKFEALCDGVQRGFFPHLKPGLSYLVHQDYKHFYEGWIHLAMYRLRASFTPVFQVSAGGTVVFKCIGDMDPEALAFPHDVMGFSDAFIDEAYEWSMSINPPGAHDAVAASHTMMYIHRKNPEKARRLLDDYLRKIPKSSCFVPEIYQLDALIEYVNRFEIADLGR